MANKGINAYLLIVTMLKDNSRYKVLNKLSN